MPYTFDFDWRNRIVRVRLHGRVTDSELREIYREGFRINFKSQPAAGLMDVSEITSVEVSAATVRELAKASPITLQESLPRVIIAPSAKAYALARLFERLSKASIHSQPGRSLLKAEIARRIGRSGRLGSGLPFREFHPLQFASFA